MRHSGCLGKFHQASRRGCIQQNRSDIVREAGFLAPSGHPDRCLVGISLILLCRAWSKLDVQVVVCNRVGDPFKVSDAPTLFQSDIVPGWWLDLGSAGPGAAALAATAERRILFFPQHL